MAYENNEKVSTWWGNSSSYAGMSCHFDGTFPANDIIKESSRDAVDVGVGYQSFSITCTSCCAIKGKATYVDLVIPALERISSRGIINGWLMSHSSFDC